jgi:hypothetical protein
MKARSRSLSRLKRALWHRAQDETDPVKRKDYRHLHEVASEAEEEIDEIVRDAEMQGIRNPAFPDDLVGWLDDDFDPPDKDDEDKKKK